MSIVVEMRECRIPKYSLYSPHVAGVGWHHGLAGLAAKGQAELGHVLNDAVDAELPWGMWIGLRLQAELFGAGAAAPALFMPQEELGWYHRVLERADKLLNGALFFQ
jgi:hypothetical protein